MRLLPIVFAVAAAHAFAACPIWLNSGNATDQASSLPYLSISAPAGSTPVTAMLTLNNPAVCNANVNTSYGMLDPVTASWLNVDVQYNPNISTLQYYFTADPTGLPAGEYLGNMQLTGSGFDNTGFLFPVLFTVTTPGGDAAHLRSSLFTASAEASSSPFASLCLISFGSTGTCPVSVPPPVVARFEVGSSSAATYENILTYSGSLPHPTPQFGLFVPSQPFTGAWLQNVTIKPSSDGAANKWVVDAGVDPTGVPTGTYYAYVYLYDQPATTAYLIPYILTIAPHPPVLNVSPTSLSLTYISNAPAAAYPATLNLGSSSTPIQYSIGAPDWLTFSSTLGTTNASLTVTANLLRLPPFSPGQIAYSLTGTVTVSNLTTGAKTQIPVTLTVKYGSSFSPGLYTDVGTVSLSTQLPPFPSVTSATVNVVSKTGPAIPFTVSASTPASGPAWFQVSPSSGTTPTALTVSLIAGSGATGGSGYITLTPTQSGLSPVKVPIVWSYHPANTSSGGSDPGISVSATTLTFSTDSALSQPQYIQMTPLNSYPADATLYCVPYPSDPSSTWLNASPINCPIQLPVQVSVDPTGLAPGTYTGLLDIMDDAGNNLNLIGVAYQVLGSSSTSSSGSAGGGPLPGSHGTARSAQPPIRRASDPPAIRQ